MATPSAPDLFPIQQVRALVGQEARVEGNAGGKRSQPHGRADRQKRSGEIEGRTADQEIRHLPLDRQAGPRTPREIGTRRISACDAAV